MESISMSIGNVLKERRISLNVKQEDIAERLGVTVQTVSKWERGVTEPKASQVHALSKILKVSEKEICRGEFFTNKSEPFDFVRKVGTLIREVPHTELLIGMQDFIEDEEGFIKMLATVSNYPLEMFKEEDIRAAKWQLQMIESGSFRFESEKDKQEMVEMLKRKINS